MKRDLWLGIGHDKEIDPTLCDVYNTFRNSSTRAHDKHNQDFNHMIHEAVCVNYDE